MTDLKTNVDKLIQKAADANNPDDAMRYSQAALNAAHTKHALANLTNQKD